MILQKINKSLATQIREKTTTKRIYIVNIRNKKNTTLVPANKKIREYYEQFYAHKFNNLDKMEKVLERHKLSKLTQEQRDNLNSHISINRIEFVVKSIPTNKS